MGELKWKISRVVVCCVVVLAYLKLVLSCFKSFWNWKVKAVTCCQVWHPILRICALPFTHPSSHTHTVVSSEHTHCEHTPGAVGSHFASVPGEQFEVAQWLFSHGIEGGRECCTLTPPTFNSCRYWDYKPTTFRLHVRLSNHEAT